MTSEGLVEWVAARTDGQRESVAHSYRNEGLSPNDVETIADGFIAGVCPAVQGVTANELDVELTRFKSWTQRIKGHVR